MRGQFAGAVLLGIVAASGASAADLANGGGYGTYALVSRMEPVIVYDFEPGVIVRCYWCPPWQNRHYFPRTGKRPKVGRREVMPTRRMQKPQEFYRYWSVSSVFAPQLSPGSAPAASDSEQ